MLRSALVTFKLPTMWRVSHTVVVALLSASMCFALADNAFLIASDSASAVLLRYVGGGSVEAFGGPQSLGIISDSVGLYANVPRTQELHIERLFERSSVWEPLPDGSDPHLVLVSLSPGLRVGTDTSRFVLRFVHCYCFAD